MLYIILFDHSFLIFSCPYRYPPLVKKLKSLTERLHAPPRWADSDLIVTAGSQDGLCKALEMMIEPGDFVVTQEPCYTGTLSIVSV